MLAHTHYRLLYLALTDSQRGNLCYLCLYSSFFLLLISLFHSCTTSILMFYVSRWSSGPVGGGEKEAVGQMRAKGGSMYCMPPPFFLSSFLPVSSSSPFCVLSPGYLSFSTHRLFLLLLLRSPPGLADFLCCPANCAT